MADTQDSILASNLTVALLSTLALALRVRARHHAGDGLKPDDCLAIAAGTMVWAIVGVIVTATSNGLGEPVNPKQPLVTARQGQALLASQALWIAAVSLARLSVLFLYRRIFDGWRYIRVSVITGGSVTLAWAVAAFVATLLQCTPINALWDSSVTGQCFHTGKSNGVTGTFNVALTLVTLLLPVPALVHISASPSTRVAIAGLFIIGTSPLIISILRLIASVQLSSSAATKLFSNASTIALYTAAEPSLVIVSSTLPILGQLLGSFVPSWRTASHHAHWPSKSTSDDSRAASAASSHLLLSKRSAEWSALSDEHYLPAPPPPCVIEVSTTLETRTTVRKQRR